MDTEDLLQKMLDEHPDDWQTRLVLADFLEEQGDVRAEGYRWLGEQRRYPAKYSPRNRDSDQREWETQTTWTWFNSSYDYYGHPEWFNSSYDYFGHPEWYNRLDDD